MGLVNHHGGRAGENQAFLDDSHDYDPSSLLRSSQLGEHIPVWCKIATNSS